MQRAKVLTGIRGETKKNNDVKRKVREQGTRILLLIQSELNELMKILSLLQILKFEEKVLKRVRVEEIAYE